MSLYRRPVYFSSQSTNASFQPRDLERVHKFHEGLPGYEYTRLVSLPGLAQECQVKAVYVKDESARLGLPAFKVLGASWGVLNAVATKLGLSTDQDWSSISASAREASIKLFTATDGNHGRAVARIARLLDLPTTVFVPSSMTNSWKQPIIEEGAHIIMSTDYDTAVKKAAAAAETEGGILVQDTSFPGYEEIPSRIVDGYGTMLHEADIQLHNAGYDCTHIITPVGVGSLAEAVVRHAKEPGRNRKVITVEPDTAACLWKSLQAQETVSIRTSRTIMTGMDCGTVSHTAWPVLLKGVDVSMSVSDFEAHQAVLYLDANGVSAGPCGAASLAALRFLAKHDRKRSGLHDDAVVVLLNTEKRPEYEVPHDVSTDDSAALTQILTLINSTNPTLSNEPGNGETDIANYIEAWLQHRDIDSYRLESQQGRPSIIGMVRGKGGGKSLMINGHIDTVSISNYMPGIDPLSGHLAEKNGRQVILGRGCLDMKAGLAVGMNAVAEAKRAKLKGDILVAAVADEEHLSTDTQDILAAGWRADAAIVTEPTQLNLGAGHKGFVWVEIEILGVAAHGSRAEDGVDAIMQSRKLLDLLQKYSVSLPTDDTLGQASLHCGLIQGGEEPSTYPASCRITIEFRTIPSQTTESIVKDLTSMLEKIAAEEDVTFKYNPPRLLLERPSYKLASDHQFLRLVTETMSGVMRRSIQAQGMAFWCDASLLGQAGIPAVIVGPSGDGLHSREEWVDVESIKTTVEVVRRVIQQYCN